MKKLLACLLLPLLLCNFTTTSNRVAAVPEYIGPGQINGGGLEFVSCGRAYKWSYAAALSAACDLVDTATGLVTGTMHFLTTGFVNTTELTGVGQACHVACSITKMYDQTGTGNDVVQATLADMPALTFNAQNGLPCAAGAAVAGMVLTGPSISQALPVTLGTVSKRTANATPAQFILSVANGGNILEYANSANTVTAGAGTGVNLTAADNATHAMLAVQSATVPLFAVDSSANTSTSTQGTTALNGVVTLMNRTTGNREMQNGFFCEGWIWPADLNSSYQATLSNARSAAFGWNF